MCDYSPLTIGSKKPQNLPSSWTFRVNTSWMRNSMFYIWLQPQTAFDRPFLSWYQRSENDLCRVDSALRNPHKAHLWGSCCRVWRIRGFSSCEKFGTWWTLIKASLYLPPWEIAFSHLSSFVHLRTPLPGTRPSQSLYLHTPRDAPRGQ